MSKEIKTGLFVVPNRSSTSTPPLVRGTNEILLSAILSTKLRCTWRQTRSIHPKPRGRTMKSSFETQWTFTKGELPKTLAQWPSTGMKDAIMLIPRKSCRQMMTSRKFRYISSNYNALWEGVHSSSVNS